MTTHSQHRSPIRRHTALQPLSRDHHHALLLIWKIRRGLNNSIDLERIKTYTDWFYTTYIRKHFEIEETFLYPLLDPEGILFQSAMNEHHQLRKLFTQQSVSKELFDQLCILLEAHIRYEERLLFQVMQEKASERSFDLLSGQTESAFVENETDCFWL